MRKKIAAAALVPALLVVSACHSEQPEQELVFVAETENTRAWLSSDLYSFEWRENERISILDGRNNCLYRTTERGVSSILASDSPVDAASESLWAVFPYSENNIRMDCSVVADIPSMQRISGGGMDADAPVSVAYTDNVRQYNKLYFSNVCSFLNITVPAEDKIVEITITGAENEILAGRVKLSLGKGNKPEFTVVDGVGSITMTSDRPVERGCVIALLPCTLQNGFYVKLRTQDGRVAVHKVVSVDENSMAETAVQFKRGVINHRSLSFDDPLWRNSPVAECVAVSESSVTIRWSENSFANPAADFNGKYLVSLFRDGEDEDPVETVEWQIDAQPNVDCPAFVFSGLEPDTDYLAEVTDIQTETAAGILKVHTLPETSVTVSADKVAEGDIIIRETFSELDSGADPVNVAFGRIDGALTANPGNMQRWNTLDFSSTRLAEWTEKTDGHTYSGPGYVRIGDSSIRKDALTTPVLSSLSDCATVRLSFKAAPYSSDYGALGSSRLGECYAQVWVVNDDVRIPAGVIEFEDNPRQWSECSMEIYNVLPTSRIEIGGAYGEKSVQSGGGNYARIYVDDIDLRLLRYEERVAAVSPEMTVGKVFWSDAAVEWTCVATPQSFRIYVDGSVVDELPPDAAAYTVRNLVPGRTYSIAVGAVYNGGEDEGRSETCSITTGAITRLTRNLSPTSLSVSIENRAGSSTNNNNPCLYVELMDSDDPENARKLYSGYVLDAQIQSPASPFMPCYAVEDSRSRTPLNVAFGGLQPGTDYWFRVKSVSRYDFTTYQTSTPSASYCVSTNGDSEFSLPVKFTTPASHAAGADEVFYQGFDELFIHGDFINCAVGSVPAFKAAGKKVGDMSLPAIRAWDGGWSFYGLRTTFPSSQLAPHYGWGEEVKTEDGIFVSPVPSGRPGAAAKVYKMKNTCGSLSGWYFTNNTFACQGCAQLGSYYSSSDNKAQTLGMIATPEIGSDLLSAEAKSCTLDFKALVIQGRSCSLEIWVFDAETGAWSMAGTRDIHNSTGSTEVASAWSALSETHRWYDYTMELSLKKGDRIAFATDMQGAVMIDEITIKLK